MQNNSESGFAPASIQPISVSPNEAARLIGIGRTTLYAAMGSGELRSLKIGKRRLITVAAINDWLSAQETTYSNLNADDER